MKTTLARPGSTYRNNWLRSNARSCRRNSVCGNSKPKWRRRLRTAARLLEALLVGHSRRSGKRAPRHRRSFVDRVQFQHLRLLVMIDARHRVPQAMHGIAFPLPCKGIVHSFRPLRPMPFLQRGSGCTHDRALGAHRYAAAGQPRITVDVSLQSVASVVACRLFPPSLP